MNEAIASDLTCNNCGHRWSSHAAIGTVLRCPSCKRAKRIPTRRAPIAVESIPAPLVERVNEPVSAPVKLVSEQPEAAYEVTPLPAHVRPRPRGMLDQLMYQEALKVAHSDTYLEDDDD